MNETFSPRELARLASAVLDNVASADDVARLEELLLADRKARDFYYRMLDLHVGLAWALGTSVKAPLKDIGSPSKPVARSPRQVPAAGFAKKHNRPASGFLAAFARYVPGGEFTVGALVVLVVVAAFWGLATAYYRGPMVANSPLGEPVAAVTASDNALWRQPPRAGLPATNAADRPVIVRGQVVELTSGIAELKLKQGVTLVVKGPATWTIDGQNNATLNRGKLVAKVPPEAVGFTLRTPSSSIVDLGTEFGVEVDSTGEANVKVLRGRIQVEPNDAPAVLLEAGDARRVMRTAIEPIALEDDYFVPKPVTITGYLDLADIACGGDGKGSRVLTGIEPDTGRFTRESKLERIESDDKYHRVDLPFVDGIFIPRGGRGPVQINSSGQTFADFSPTEDQSWGNLWVYADKSIYLHANKGITIDLEALRKHHHDRITRFTATVQNLERSPPDEASFFSADLWVFVDGQVRFSAIKFRGSHGELNVDVRLDDTSRFLTLVATDSGNTIGKDGISFSNCRLTLAADHNPSTP